QIAHARLGFLLEEQVARGEYLVDQQDFRALGSRDGKRQPHQHARGIAANRQIEKITQLGEFFDLLELRLDRFGFFALQVGTEVDILPAGGVVLEAQGDVIQGADRAFHGAAAALDGIDAADGPQQGALAGTVQADDADALAVMNLKGEIDQGLDGAQRVPLFAEPAMQDEFLQGDSMVFAHRVFQTHPVEANEGHACNSPAGSIKSKKSGSAPACAAAPWPARRPSQRTPGTSALVARSAACHPEWARA